MASLLVLVAPNIAVLGALRVLQGVGTAAGAVVALAVVRDLYTGRAAATLLSRLFLVHRRRAGARAHARRGAAALHLLARASSSRWRSTGCCSWSWSGALLPETLPPERAPVQRAARHRPGLPRAASGTGCSSGLVVVAGLTMAGLFSYVSGSSFVYQDEFGLDEQQFGLLFGAGAVWLIAATQLNPVLLRRLSPRRSSSPALALAGALAGVVLLVLAVTGTGGLFGVAIPIWVVLFASGLALPNAPALALTRHGECRRHGRRPARCRAVRRRRGGLPARRRAGQRRARRSARSW